jgi:nucleotidyltransferase/DNA polymerase involved in DNA repair
MESPPRKIIHIDMDAFYASIEQRDDPSLRGRPVVVGSPAARGVIAAASYEARKFGVRSAMPSSTALRKCPQLVFVPHRMEVYRAVSRQIHAVFADYTDLIEPLSLDEAYLDVTADLAGVGAATQTARRIRQAILDETGLTASAGISYNKFLAKMASDQNKPNGQFLVAPGQGEAFVATLPIGRFHGVGQVTEAKMKSLAIATGEDLRQQSLAFLVQPSGGPGPGSTRSRAGSTCGPSTQTENASPPGRRPPSRPTFSTRAASRPRSPRSPTGCSPGAKRLAPTDARPRSRSSTPTSIRPPAGARSPAPSPMRRPCARSSRI